jgi:hypothetical protein
LNIRRLIVPLTLGLMTIHAGQGFAQGAFPAPLPGQAAPSNASPFPPANGGASPFPPVNGAAPAASAAPRSSFPVTGAAPVTGSAFERQPASPSQQGGPADECMKGFVPLREEAEKRGKLIKAAGDRKAPPDEACKLIGNYAQAEVKMIVYIDSHAAKCGIPPQIAEQLKNGHKGTEGLQKRVCMAAQQQQQQQKTAAPSLSEALGSSAALPEASTAKRSGGSTFDTLNGNVLAR